MSAVKPLFLVLALMSVALAGCVSEPEDLAVEPTDPEECLGEEKKLCGGDAILDDAGRDLRTDLTANDTLPAPKWEVGDVFEQHLYYGTADTRGEHIQTMVVDDSGGCYQFGTTSQLAARTEATYDLPILGCIGKDKLGTTGFGADWAWMYDFPLQDGKTWEGSVSWMFNWNSNSFVQADFTLTATYAPAINTFTGDFPGFLISGVTEDGEEILSYNYVPAVGWFSHFWMYDLDTEDPEDIVFHAMSMGTAEGFTGTYYIDESETAVQSWFMPPLSVMASEDVEPLFTVPEGTTYLKGVVVPIACFGASKVVLASPGNQQQQFDHQHMDAAACAEIMQAMSSGQVDTPDPRMFTIYHVDQPAEAGDWRVFNVPTGGFAGYFIWLDAVTEVAYELTEADLPTKPSE